MTITGGEVVTHRRGRPDRRGGRTGAPTARAGRSWRLRCPAPGDFSTYRLTILSGKLDPFFDSAPFRFKANCPTTLDCATPAPSCPAVGRRAGADRLPRQGFRQLPPGAVGVLRPALPSLGGAVRGRPRRHADGGARGDGRRAQLLPGPRRAESTIQTATQRLSVVRHARLVDYEPAPATTATTMPPARRVEPSMAPPARAGRSTTPLLCRALGADGSVIDFEIEDPAAGLADAPAASTGRRTGGTGPACRPTTGTTASAACWPGRPTSTSLGQDLGLSPGQQLLLDSPAATAPIRRSGSWSPCRGADETADPVIWYPAQAALTRVFLRRHDRGPRPGRAPSSPGTSSRPSRALRQSETFMIPGPQSTPPPGPVVVRVGANWTPQDPLPDYRYCLASGPLAWLATTDQDKTPAARAARDRAQRDPGRRHERHATVGVPALAARRRGRPTRCSRSRPSSTRRCSRATARPGIDYDGDGGTTIRFGDGTFGTSPAAGHGLQRALPRGRRLGRQRPRGHDRQRRAGAGAGIAHQRVHQPLSRHRRRGRRDHRAGAQPRAAEVRRGAASRRAGQRLRGGGAVAPVGAAGGHHVPLDGQLADRAHAAPTPPGARSRRSPSSSRSPSCWTSGGWPATRATSCRRATSRSICGSRSARSPPASASDVQAAVLARLQPGSAPRRRGRVLRPLTLELRRAAGVERAARRHPVMPGRRRRPPGRVPRARRPARTGRRCPRRSRSPPTRSCASTTTRAGRRPDRCR